MAAFFTGIPPVIWNGMAGEVYLVGCLKAGGLLKDVPGTAEDWLKKVEFYRPAHVILRRLER